MSMMGSAEASGADAACHADDESAVAFAKAEARRGSGERRRAPRIARADLLRKSRRFIVGILHELSISRMHTSARASGLLVAVAVAVAVAVFAGHGPSFA